MSCAIFRRRCAVQGLISHIPRGMSLIMIMSFAQPLGVGLTSDGEYMDVEVRTGSRRRSDQPAE